MKLVDILAKSIIIVLSLIILVLLACFLRKHRNRVVFGSTPILNNKYWCEALKNGGFKAETIMKGHFSEINKSDDFDYYFQDFLPVYLTENRYKRELSFFFVWIHLIRHAKYIVMPFNGFAYSKFVWKVEYLLVWICDIKTILFPFGSDAYMYSRIKDPSLQYALLTSYPDLAKQESLITKRVEFWSRKADFIAGGFMAIDGFPRWDMTIGQFIQIDDSKWSAKSSYSTHDGKNGVVKILHTPNHRGFKGTEFIIDAVENLKAKGFRVELVLMEGVQNEKVKEYMQECDILAEQLIASGYALSGIEGMASGLPVLANLENKTYTELFKLFSFLGECPVVSTSPETVEKNLQELIENPKKRKIIGQLGREYVNKYHSYEASLTMFSAIFESIESQSNKECINTFHPLKSRFSSIGRKNGA